MQWPPAKKRKKTKTKIIRKSCYETRESRVVETRDATTSLTFFFSIIEHLLRKRIKFNNTIATCV